MLSPKYRLVLATLWCAASQLGCSRFAESNAPVILGAAHVVSTSTGVGTSPNLALSPSGSRAIVWVTEPNGGTDARLAISVDNASPTIVTDSLGAIQAVAEAPPQVAFGPNNSVYVLYVVAKDVGKRFPISALRFIQSTDHGHTWSQPVSVTDQPEPYGAHNYQSLYVGDDGTIYASWLDGRSGTTATYLTHSTDSGHTWAPNVKISVGETCPCCRTAVASAPHGAVYVAWRTVLPGSIRDIVVSRSSDYGVTWTTPQRVHADNWVFGGCPHAGPSIKLDQNGALHVLWWTGDPNHGGVWYTVSTDSARSFATPIAIDPQHIPLPTHVQLALGPNGRVISVWDDLQTNPSSILMRVSSDSGRTFSKPVTLSDDQLSAQHPMLGLSNDTAYIAWSETQTPMSHDMSEHHTMHKGLTPVGQTNVVMRTVRLTSAL